MRRPWSNAQKFGALASLPGLLVLMAFLFYPVLYNFYLSFHQYNLITPIQFTGLENYSWLLNEGDFWQSMSVSAIYSVTTATLSVLVGFAVAYGLSRVRRGRTALRTLVILPWAIPGVISGFMWKWILDGDLGILNYLLVSIGLVEENVHFLTDPVLGMVSGVLATTYITVPFMSVLFLAGLESIPSELYEASTVDGADMIHQLFRISLPLIQRRIIFVWVLRAMFSFRTPDFFYVLTRGGPGKSTFHMGLLLQRLIFNFFELGRGAVVGVAMTIIIVAFAAPPFYFAIVKRNTEM